MSATRGHRDRLAFVVTSEVGPPKGTDVCRDARDRRDAARPRACAQRHRQPGRGHASVHAGCVRPPQGGGPRAGAPGDLPRPQPDRAAVRSARRRILRHHERAGTDRRPRGGRATIRRPRPSSTSSPSSSSRSSPSSTRGTTLNGNELARHARVPRGCRRHARSTPFAPQLAKFEKKVRAGAQLLPDPGGLRRRGVRELHGARTHIRT